MTQIDRNFPVRGLADIDRFLSQLPKKLETAAYRSGLTAAAGVIRDEAKRRAPARAPKVAKAIKSGSPRKNSDGTFSVRVYVDERANDQAFVGYFFEWGTRPHAITLRRNDGGKKGRNAAAREANGGKSPKAMTIEGGFASGSIMHPGMRRQPFLIPALDTKANEAVAAFRDKVISVIEGKTGFDARVALADAA